MADSCKCKVTFRSTELSVLNSIQDIFEGGSERSDDGSRALPAKALAVACWGTGTAGSATGTKWIEVIDSKLNAAKNEYWVIFDSAYSPPIDGLRSLNEQVFKNKFDYYCTYSVRSWDNQVGAFGTFDGEFHEIQEEVDLDGLSEDEKDEEMDLSLEDAEAMLPDADRLWMLTR